MFGIATYGTEKSKSLLTAARGYEPADALYWAGIPLSGFLWTLSVIMAMTMHPKDSYSPPLGIAQQIEVNKNPPPGVFV